MGCLICKSSTSKTHQIQQKSRKANVISQSEFMSNSHLIFSSLTSLTIISKKTQNSDNQDITSPQTLVPFTRFSKLTIHCNKLSLKDPKEFFSRIGSLDNLQELNITISKNYLFLEGQKQLTFMLSKLKNLQKLSLQLFSEMKVHLSYFFFYLDHLVNLESLELRLVIRADRKNQNFFEGLSFNLKKLQKITNLSLNIDCDSFNEDEARHVSNGLKGIQNSLKSLALVVTKPNEFCNFERVLMKGISKIRSLEKLKINFLGYRGQKNKILQSALSATTSTSTGCSQSWSPCISDQLGIGQLTNLKSLVLEKLSNYSLYNTELYRLSQEIQYLSDLKTLDLNLGEINIQGEQNYQKLGDAILSISCLSELKLSLISRNISKNAEFLSKLTQIHNLSILSLSLVSDQCYLLDDLDVQWLGINISRLSDLQQLSLKLINTNISTQSIMILDKEIAKILKLNVLSIGLSDERQSLEFVKSFGSKQTHKFLKIFGIDMKLSISDKQRILRNKIRLVMIQTNEVQFIEKRQN